MKCVSCLQGLNWECRQKGECNDVDFNSHDADSSGGAIGAAIGSILGAHSTVNGGNQADQIHEVGSNDPDPDEFATYKDDSVLRDQQSTGRKRAAKMYPLDEHAPCEWKMQKNAGGGTMPIVGCINGTQQARHHGPDKNTLNNERGNVHRICHTCHNRWHTLNDPDYVWEGLHEAHAPIDAIPDEIAQNEIFWAGRKLTKAKD